MNTAYANTQKAQTELLDACGAFFAFSQEQFLAARKPGVKYSNLGAGLICEKANVEQLTNGLKAIHRKGIAQDLAENGREGVIRRELDNHEAFYTWDIDDTVSALEPYGISREEVQKVFNEARK